jgi:hypothetical protein
MNRRLWHLNGSLVAVVAALALGACSTGSPVTSGAGSQAPGGGGGGGAASVAACTLLTSSEAQQALGVAVDNGTLTTVEGQATCSWAGADDTSAVTVNVQDYDANFWNAGAGSQMATAVSGLGEKAFKGWPTAGSISIKQGSYEIDVAVVSFTLTNDQEAAGALSLAKLVLPRISS